MIIRKKWTINFLKFFNKNKNTRRLHFNKIRSQKKTKYHYQMHAIKTSIVNNFSGLMHIRISRMRAACWKIITLYFMTVFNSSPTYLLRKRSKFLSKFLHVILNEHCFLQVVRPKSVSSEKWVWNWRRISVKNQESKIIF